MIDEEKFLRDLNEAQEYLVGQYPDTIADEKLPLKFQRKMNKIIERHDHKVLYFVKKVVAIAFLLLGISGGIVMGFNEKVRADVLGWIRERFSSNVFSYYNQSKRKVDISRFSVKEYVPEDYEFKGKSEREGRFSETYSNDEGYMIVFSVISPDYDGDIYVYSDEKSDENLIHIEQFSADLYISDDEQDANTIVWKNDQGVCFIISAHLNSQQLVELAEKID